MAGAPSLLATQRPEDKDRTEMIIPVSKETFFNTKWNAGSQPLCPYDMLFHPPDYDQKSARSDRRDPEKIRQNIWLQEKHKPIASTTYLMYGRPYWEDRKMKDWTTKNFARAVMQNQKSNMRIHDVLKWAELLLDSKEQCNL